MPSAGYSHFYGLYTAAKHQIWKCVNALGGLFSFLPTRLLATLALMPGRVNALGGLFSFLHILKGEKVMRYDFVSMPSAGYSHFYDVSQNSLLSLLKILCQCPRRAILISTYWRCRRHRDSCNLVSMPSAGYSHFYINRLQDDTTITRVCQCPRRAILISTRATDEGTVFYAVCQCPRRAILISTNVVAVM